MEKEQLARILMKDIVATLNGNDFGEINRPHKIPRLGYSGVQLFNKYYARLTKEKQEHYDKNYDLIIKYKRDLNELEAEGARQINAKRHRR